MEKTNALTLNQQTQNEILKNGLKLNETIAEINKVIANYGIVEQVNYIDITYNDTKTGQTSIYLINYTEAENKYESAKYDYLEKKYNKDNDGEWHPFKIKTHLETNEKKCILNYISFIAASADFKKCGKPEKGYILKELPNNKPNTLLNAKNKNFVCFFAVGRSWIDSTPNICEFDINEEKETFKKNYFNCFSSWNDATRSRIEANKIFVCYNSNICNYWKNRNNIIEKQRKREQFKKDTFLQNRYLYNDADYQRFLKDYYNIVKWWYIAQCELTRTDADNIEPGSYIEYKEMKIYHGCTTRPQLYKYLFDKNGFFKLPYIMSLKERTEELKREKARQQAEHLRQVWQNSDHTEQIKEINTILNEIKNIITPLLNFETFLKDYTLKKLDIFKEIYKDFEKLKNFNTYADIERWNAAKEETENKYNFYLTALNRGALDKKIACMHQYEKTETGYKMTDKYINDPFYKNYNYVLEF